MRVTRRIFIRAASCVAISLVCVASARGQETGPSGSPDLLERTSHRFSLRGGLLFTEHRTVARVDAESTGAGTTVDVERELGLDEWTRDLRFDAALRFGRRHQVQVGYLSLTRRGRTTLVRRVRWGDAVFEVDVDVESVLDVTLIPAAYRFAILLDDRLDVGLSAGVFAVLAEAGVTAPAAGVTERGSSEFPLPVVGIDGTADLGKGFFLTGGAKYFALEIDGVEGSWREFRTAVEYFPLKRFGVGVGHRFIRLEADGTEGIHTRPEGTLLFLDYEFSGPHVYLTVAL